MKTIKVRVKDKHIKLLRKMSIEVNQVWNYCKDLNIHKYAVQKKYFNAFDFSYLLKGWSKTESNLIGNSSIQETASVCAGSFFQHKFVRWRKSFGKKRNLGWVPFKSRAAKFKKGKVFFAGNFFDVWDSYGLDKYTFRAGSFVEDSQGKWFFCVCVQEMDSTPEPIKNSVGIDLGLKTVATTSDGDKLDGRWYRNSEAKLAAAQRANKYKRIKAIHAKIKNRRKDAMHKFSRKLVNEYQNIFVGGVSSKAMIKKGEGFAKSTLDSGWGILKTMLKYKGQQAGRVFKVVNEAWTTQTCSSCGSRTSSPKGVKGLGIRQWVCTECGVSHDRDVNAALNIVAVGHGRLAVGIPNL